MITEMRLFIKFFFSVAKQVVHGIKILVSCLLNSYLYDSQFFLVFRCPVEYFSRWGSNLALAYKRKLFFVSSLFTAYSVCGHGKHPVLNASCHHGIRAVRKNEI